MWLPFRRRVRCDTGCAGCWRPSRIYPQLGRDSCFTANSSRGASARSGGAARHFAGYPVGSISLLIQMESSGVKPFRS